MLLFLLFVIVLWLLLVFEATRMVHTLVAGASCLSPAGFTVGRDW